MTDPRSVLSGGNLFNRLAFPGNTLVADEEASGHEAWRIATGRRSPYTNYYTSITANVQRTLTLTCDRVRAADFLVLDRGHNLTRLILEISDVADFSSPAVLFDITLPTSTGAGSLDDDFGVRSEEGAWYKRFPERTANYWRLKIPAMGANQRPKIVGANLSLSYDFDPWRPTSPDATELGGELTESDGGWRAMMAWNRRVDALRIQLSDLFDYDLWFNVFQHFVKYRPAFYVPDDSWAQNACCIAPAPGVIGLGREPDWFPHKGVVPYIEHEPAGVNG